MSLRLALSGDGPVWTTTVAHAAFPQVVPFYACATGSGRLSPLSGSRSIPLRPCDAGGMPMAAGAWTLRQCAGSLSIEATVHPEQPAPAATTSTPGA